MSNLMPKKYVKFSINLNIAVGIYQCTVIPDNKDQMTDRFIIMENGIISESFYKSGGPSWGGLLKQGPLYLREYSQHTSNKWLPSSGGSTVSLFPCTCNSRSRNKLPSSFGKDTRSFSLSTS